jgi:glc operon protein GlcG
MRQPRRLAVTAAIFVALAVLAPRPARAQPMPNPYGAPITTEVAKKAAAAALAEARKNGWTVYATVVDTGGFVAYVERIDGVQVGSAEASYEKARASALFKRPTKLFEERIAANQLQYLKLPGSIPLEGGVPILVDGKVVGAIGVSGATSAQDGQCARAGAEAITPPPPAH